MMGHCHRSACKGSTLAAWILPLASVLAFLQPINMLGSLLTKLHLHHTSKHELVILDSISGVVPLPLLRLGPDMWWHAVPQAQQAV